MQDLAYVPLEEIRRALSFPADRFVRARLFAEICRINTLYMISYAGSGHIGSSFSSLDIVSWLFLEEMEKDATGKYQDVYFSSKGHDAPGLYAVLIGLELLEFPLLHRLRRLGGLPGHPDIHTPFCHTNTGPLGMGISKAKGMLKARHLLGQRGRVFVLMGDGELQEGQVWESLVSAANDGLEALTVIVDHNKIQSDTWVKDVSDLGDLEAKFQAFGWGTACCSGHDFAGLQQALSKLKEASGKPGILLADTLKGRGVGFMEEGPQDGLYAYHSGAPSHEVYERALSELQDMLTSLVSEAGIREIRCLATQRPAVDPLQAPQKLVVAYSHALVSQAEKNPRLVALDADLVLDCGLIPFRKKFPDRFVECGIAEQDMVSQVHRPLEGERTRLHSIFYQPQVGPEVARYNCERQDHGIDDVLDRWLIEQAKPALDARRPVRIETKVRNTNRIVGAMLSGEVAKRFGHQGLADDTIWIKCVGTAGQSFGGFLARGVTLELEGDANDYVGKGMSGGRLIVYPPSGASSTLAKTSSSATPCSTAPSTAKPISAVSPVSVSPSATLAFTPSSRAWATTAANT